MKHLKKFENKDILKLTYVDFTPDDGDFVDNYLALYVNGVLIKYGDHDNDRISQVLEGIEIGLKYHSKIEKEYITCEDKEYCENMWNNELAPPKTLDELEVIINGQKWDYYETLKEI